MRSRPLSFYSKLDFVKVLMELERLWQEGMIENFRYKKTSLSMAPEIDHLSF